MDARPDISFWYGHEQRFGGFGCPQKWFNLLGRVTSNNGIHDCRWTLNDREMGPFPVGPGAYRLKETGDFNLEIAVDGLEIGTSSVDVTVCDRKGNISVERCVIRREPCGPGKLPYRVAFTTEEFNTNRFQIVDGLWEFVDSGIRTAEIGYDRIIALGDMEWSNYQVSVVFTLHRWDGDPLHHLFPSMSGWVGLGVGWEGHFDWHDIYPRRGWHPYGALFQLAEVKDGVPEMRLLGNRITPIAENRPVPEISDGVSFALKAEFAARPSNVSEYRLKYWLADRSEPEEWHIAGSGVPTEKTCGSTILVAHHADVTIHEAGASAIR